MNSDNKILILRIFFICLFISSFSLCVISSMQDENVSSSVLEKTKSSSTFKEMDQLQISPNSLHRWHQKGREENMDILQPYLDHHGPKHRTHRQIRECQHVKYGNVTHSKVKAHGDLSNLSLPIGQTRHIIHVIQETIYIRRDVLMHHTIINNPQKTLSVLEPVHKKGCGEGRGARGTVIESAKQKDCIVAMNAGFFNTHTGACYGNIVSDGRLVQDSGGVQNAHFGVTKDGFLYTGYLSEIDLIAQDFEQLVGGVIWLIRDGKSYIDESIKIECSDTEETGTLQRFASVMSARTAVGHDKEGRVIFMQADGKTDDNGLTLKEFVDILLQYGVVNAVNLDGGGSATYAVNGTLVNYPSDTCADDKRYNCARDVSTILCVHLPDCPNPNCSDHGSCVLGQCNCTGYWTGPQCETLQCPENCSGHGLCTAEGCSCEAGWKGDNCNMTCSNGRYGANCQYTCTCINGAECNPFNGSCICKPGFSGTFCDKPCPFGFHGSDCQEVCICNDGCPCDSITGSCNITDWKTEFVKAGVCYAKQKIQREHLVPDQSSVYRMCLTLLIIISILATVSIIVNVILTFKFYTKKKHKSPKRKRAVLTNSKQLYRFPSSGSEEDLSSFSDYPMEESSFIKK